MTMQLTADVVGHAPFPSHQLLEMIRADADDADGRASLGPATFERMRSEGLFHLLVPPELGGTGGTPRAWFDGAVAVAHADASAGWILAQAAVQNAWIAVAAADRFAGEYFASRQTIATSGAARVPATLVGDPDSGTYVVEHGRWPYVSGCIHADYVGGMVMIAGPDGSVSTRLVLQPFEEATIRPTWDTLGLRASASHDVDLGERAEVPAERTFTWPGLTVARPGRLANATTTIAMISFSAAAVTLAARRALEVAVESAEQKRRPLDKVPLIEQSGFVRGFAGLSGRLDVATAGLQHLLDELWDRAGDGEAPNAVRRAGLRLAATDAVTTGAEVVRAAALLVGADATHRAHPLERLTRDGGVLIHHVSVSASSQERLGTVLLGSYRGPGGLI